jgi:hypothetical protein
MKILTSTWFEANEFFRRFVGFHDSTIEAVQICSETKSCVMTIEDVFEYSIDYGHHIIFEQLSIEMFDVVLSESDEITNVYGYDIVDSELKPESLWVSTLNGSIVFHFSSIRFILG